MRHRPAIAWAFSLGLAGAATAQERAAAPPPEPPAFARLRQDEDYAYLADPAAGAGLVDRFKYIPLGEGPAFLSLGGELRYRYEYTRRPGFGAEPQDRGAFLQRYILHADLRVSPDFRLFGQFLSAFAHGRAEGPSPVDQNRFDLQQGFVDIAFEPVPGARVTLRPGRQEVRLGSARLVDVREGPNLRRSFDGARATLQLPGWQVDALALRPVAQQPGAFDDRTGGRQALWGLYGVGRPGWLPAGSIDFYYLGFRDDAGRYDKGTAAEMRHSLGTRLWGERGAWDWNNEFVYQFGDFGGGPISAWTAAFDIGHSWKEAWLAPRLGLATAAASGDGNPTGKGLRTFNPLFPRGNYFSELALLGPRNFFNVNPSLSLTPHRDITLTGGVSFFWRQSLEDGVYAPNGSVLRAAGGSSARYVGTEFSLSGEWRANRYTTFTAIYSSFLPGDFIRQTGSSKEISYLELTIKIQL